MSEQTKSRSASQGTLLWRISKKFNFAAEKIIRIPLYSVSS